MALFSSLSAAAVTMIVLAQETLPVEWGNLTALGIVAVVIIFIVTKMLPDLHKKFVEQSIVFATATKEMQISFTKTLETLQLDFSSTVKVNQATFADSVTKIHAKTEIWEQARHQDLINLTRAIAQLTSQCASHLGKFRIEMDSKEDKK